MYVARKGGKVIGKCKRCTKLNLQEIHKDCILTRLLGDKR